MILGADVVNLSLGSTTALTAQEFVNVLLVMTVSILVGVILVPLIGKKLQNGMAKMGGRDAKWAGIFQNSLFIGMISAFLGFVFCEMYMLWTPSARFITETVVVDGQEVEQQVAVSATYGLIPVGTMIVSALTMVVCGLLMKNPKMKWLGEYALPISLVVGMAAAIPLTVWLG